MKKTMHWLFGCGLYWSKPWFSTYVDGTVRQCIICKRTQQSNGRTFVDIDKPKKLK